MTPIAVTLIDTIVVWKVDLFWISALSAVNWASNIVATCF